MLHCHWMIGNLTQNDVKFSFSALKVKCYDVAYFHLHLNYYFTMHLRRAVCCVKYQSWIHRMIEHLHALYIKIHVFL